MNAQAIPLTAGHGGSMSNYANAEGARQLVVQNLQKRASMRNTGTKQPAAQVPAATAAAKVTASGLKPIELKDNTGPIACAMSFLNAFLEVVGIVHA
ncbi:MAG TPA: hypothetical protein EYN91_26130 [Candidatus Melainabacteria bacterium]|jgi:hypothetical protein|nr:hypothetical protein [Candidatus Melainabacteria bacterium]